MDVFKLRNAVVTEYRSYVESFIRVHDPRIDSFIAQSLKDGQLLPDAVLQLNPAFEMDKTLGELSKEGLIAKETAQFFGESIRLYKHQRQALDIAVKNEPYVVTTGTGSGKSLTYLVPIYDWITKHNPAEHSVRAIIVYPMNALINSQLNAAQKYQKQFPSYQVRFDRFTGQESDEVKNAIRNDPPHVLLTNYVMLEYILMRPSERSFLQTATADLQFMVMDELHFLSWQTGRGRWYASAASPTEKLAMYRLLSGRVLPCPVKVTVLNDVKEIAKVAGNLFGVVIKPENVVDETLKRVAKALVPTTKEELCKAVEMLPPQPTLDSVTTHPLAAWAEEAFGLTHDKENRLIRRSPETFTDIAKQLCDQTGINTGKCVKSLQAVLEIGNLVEVYPDQPVFAFRLHQFVSSGGSIYSTLETAKSAS